MVVCGRGIAPKIISAQRAVQVENDENLFFHSFFPPFRLSLARRSRELSHGVGRGCQRSFSLAGRRRSSLLAGLGQERVLPEVFFRRGLIGEHSLTAAATTTRERACSMRLIPGEKWRIVAVIRETQLGVSISPWETKKQGLSG